MRRIAPGATPLFEASWKGYRDVAALLIEKGANVKAVNLGNGIDASPRSCRKGHSDVVELLIAHGANPCAKDKSGATAARPGAGVSPGQNRRGISRSRIPARKRIGLQAIEGCGASRARGHGEILLDRGADPNIGLRAS